ncbi:hypothetical protein ACQR5V_11880 [Xanthomonas oryzae pv. oryzicola]|uniref:hypothetical protein n=1 Tax=Xanthomonas oryzae TaxID=347 RepID=UPI000463C32C|nr:hypothetical protein [Xanthomonas oryzae]AJQ86314.1 hypothetical protein BE73_03730 [Xanthomonas oryzae pv. oryzicola]AKK65392.1 hypothetical protein FE36_17045 [Xanthomonas oryzae pv. oryzicola]AKN99627.1 hypothetical protein ACU15_02930 [Xanthomonas oryzae pv. oryzicola]AKO03368.1 hypothetical protein ACU16_03490 [Xanthomonas oryzae pv. oryzicola]AKO07258.1 hypothetical protein ACU17_03340 [Xanthomonas oryzae pv. oryzicola]
MHAVSAPVQADVQTALDDWRDEHRRGQLGYHVFDGIPEGTIRAVCTAYNARARLTDAEAIKAVRDARCLAPGSTTAVLADWLVPRGLRHVRGA